MNVIEKVRFNEPDEKSLAGSSLEAMRIVMSPPEHFPFEQEMKGEPSNATYIIQGYIAKGLAAREHELTFLSQLNPGEIIYTDDPLEHKPARLTWTGGKWFNIASKASWWVQRRLGIPYLNYFNNYRLYDACMQCLPGNDVVYERNGLYKYGVAMACKRLGLPYVLYIEADDILESDYMGKPIKGLLRWRAREAAQYNLDAADCVICVSEALRDHLERNWRVPEEKLVVFANVADVQRFRPDPASRKEVREAHGVGESPLIVFVGNFYEWHDVRTLLDAFAGLLESAPEAKLMLVGDGSQRRAMMQYISELALDHAVTFTGLVPHDEVPRYLSAADIGVVPYPPMDTDLWLSPLKLFEYMASGTAIVASDIGQIRHVIESGKNGLLVPAGDVATMTAALHRLIDDPALRRRLADQGREDAVNKHSWERYLTRLEQVLQAVRHGQPYDQI